MIIKVECSEFDKKTLKNLSIESTSLVDDYYDYTKVVVRKPWGYEYLLYGSDTIAVWVLYLKSGAETSMHCHTNKKTSLVVLQGEVECCTHHQNWKRTEGEGLLLEKGVFHQTRAVSLDGAFVMEIESPVNKRDLVRLKDRYGREKKGYETAHEHSWNTQNYNYLSLHNLDVYYNLKKRFGHCTLTFDRFRNSQDLVKLTQLNPEDVVCFLSGHVLDEKNQPLFEVGDTIAVQDLKKIPILRVGHYVEVLVIKKIDRIIKVSDYVVRFFKEQNISNVFIAPGDANLHLLDSIGRDEIINFYCTPMERGASIAAEAYSKTKNGLGVLIVSSGLSGPNALPGVASAWVDSTPLLVISGQARSDQEVEHKCRQLGNKSLHIIDIVKPITKYAVQVKDPTMIRCHLEEAVYHALSGRPGPVWLSIPIDILGMSIDENDLKPFHAPVQKNFQVNSSNNALEKSCGEIFKLLAESKRPVLLIGNGIRLSNSQEELFKLIDTLKIPTLTSRRGTDLIPTAHPFFYGRPGMYGQRSANFIIQNSDLLINLGSRLSIPAIGRNIKAFTRAAKKIMVDIDPGELEKSTIPIDLAIHVNVKDFLKVFLRQLDERKYIPPEDISSWIKQCEHWQHKFHPLSEGYEHKPGFINPYLFTYALSEELRENDIIVADGLFPMSCVMQMFKFKKSQKLISSTGLELPGFALPGVLGASVASNKSGVICLCEDHGFQMGLSELQTIAENKLPIKIFVLNSKGSIGIRTAQNDFFGGRNIGTDTKILLGAPSLSALGNLYGFKTFNIENPHAMHSQIQNILKIKEPVLCEIKVDPSQLACPRFGYTVKEDGKWLAKPLEDLYPLIDRKILQENMLIGTVAED